MPANPTDEQRAVAATTPCPECDGQGEAPSKKAFASHILEWCDDCNGTGRIPSAGAAGGTV